MRKKLIVLLLSLVVIVTVPVALAVTFEAPSGDDDQVAGDSARALLPEPGTLFVFGSMLFALAAAMRRTV